MSEVVDDIQSYVAVNRDDDPEDLVQVRDRSKAQKRKQTPSAREEAKSDSDIEDNDDDEEEDEEEDEDAGEKRQHSKKKARASGRKRALSKKAKEKEEAKKKKADAQMARKEAAAKKKEEQEVQRAEQAKLHEAELKARADKEAEAKRSKDARLAAMRELAGTPWVHTLAHPKALLQVHNILWSRSKHWIHKVCTLRIRNIYQNALVAAGGAPAAPVAGQIAAPDPHVVVPFVQNLVPGISYLLQILQLCNFGTCARFFFSYVPRSSSSGSTTTEATPAPTECSS